MPVTEALRFHSHQLSGMVKYQPQEMLWYVSAATASFPLSSQRSQRTKPSVCSADPDSSGAGISI